MTGVGSPHDRMFKALLDDPGRAATLVREYLPAEILARLADTPPELVDGSFVDEHLSGTSCFKFYQVVDFRAESSLAQRKCSHVN
ncbi:MAG: hypothetical protein GVY13_03725 [Alphaproteobacteria bacterium]|jgi:hypothetical protein|nr:hypothetical protein [Alphaproteobacteria bacterium]